MGPADTGGHLLPLLGCCLPKGWGPTQRDLGSFCEPLVLPHSHSYHRPLYCI